MDARLRVAVFCYGLAVALVVVVWLLSARGGGG